MTKDQINKFNKYRGGMDTYNLWNLFDYDELTINMRQKMISVTVKFFLECD